jgi:hypothetical protein
VWEEAVLAPHKVEFDISMEEMKKTHEGPHLE